MKKRIISMLLVLVMVLGMVPMQVFAATDLTVSGGTITLPAGMIVGPATLTKLDVYTQGDYTPVSITGATLDGNTINVVLADTTNPSAAIQAGFSSTGGTVSHSGNKCTLAGGTGQMTVKLTAFTNQPHTVQYTINFSIPMGEACTVTPPAGEGFTFTGKDSAYKDSDYSFKVSVNEGYNGSAMKVGYVFDGTTTYLDGTNGSYTIASVPGDITIVVEGVAAREKRNLTYEVAEGITLSPQAEWVYEGDAYIFTVAVDGAYDATNMVVAVDGETVGTAAGEYKIDSVTEDTKITVTGVVKKTGYTVTLTEGENYTISGQATSYAGEPYTFSIAVDDAIYWASNIVVKVNGETVTLTDGRYTIEALNVDTVVTVENVVEREILTVTKPELEGVTVTGGDNVRDGKPYTFSITVSEIYDASNMEVKVNDERVDLANGSYTIPSVTADVTITVSGLTKQAICVVEKPTGKKFTFTGDDFAPKGTDYTFTVTPQLGYVATVSVNGEAITGTNNQYTVKADSETLTIAVTTQRVPLPDKRLTVTDNGGSYTAGVTSNQIVNGLSNRYHATVTGIKVTGAVVNEAYEDGRTVYFMLDKDTPDTAKVDIEFQHTTSDKNVKLVQSKWSLDLEDGEGGLKTVVTVRYSSISRYDKTSEYTLIFFREIPAAEPPARIVESDTAEVWKGWPLEINLNRYFTDADTYYLVKGEIKTPIEGNVYTYMSPVAGEQTLVFHAENEVGFSEPVTVTVTVKDVESGVYIGYNSGGGSVDTVVFTDADGNPIEGIEVNYADRVITVSLPKSYPLSGKVTATFTRTANDSNFPRLSSSNAFNQGDGSWSDVYTNTLSNGAATRYVYLYNSKPGATNNNPATFTITYKIRNEKPVLAEEYKTPGQGTIKVNEEYTLDLTPVFTDEENDTLSYSYKVGQDGEWKQIAGKTLVYNNTLAADYVLYVKAFDTKDYSDDLYVINLTVEDLDETYTLTVHVPEDVQPSFYRSDEAGTLGAELEAEGENGVYRMELPVNNTHIAWRANGMGMHAAVPESKGLNLIKADFTVMAGQTQDEGSVVTVKYGDLVAPGKDNSFLLLDGITYTVSATTTINGYKTTEKKDFAFVNGSGSYQFDLMQNHFTVIAPKGSVVSAGTLEGCFLYSFKEALEVVEEDDKVIYKFAPQATDATKNRSAFVRVQRPEDPDAVTYWLWDDTSSMADGKTITITEANLHMNDGVGAKTVNRSFQHNDLDLGDIYMNINAQGYLNMSAGATKQLNMFRNWQAIERYTNLMVAQPDFHYQVIDLEGSNVVSVTANEYNSGTATLTANNPGTAIVLVTYDAMNSSQTAKNSGGEGGGGERWFSAIWPERTGVFVVSVGKDGTGIQTNIMANNGRTFDAEHDPVFYTGEEGASVRFKPEEGCTVTVNRGIVGANTLSFGGFTDEGVEVAQDGTVTVSGLTTGRHIIRVKKGDIATYQVVTAQQVSVSIKDADGKMVTEDSLVNAGETLTLTVTGLTSPAEKLATVYNYNFTIDYRDDLGNSYNNFNPNDDDGTYNFSSTPQVVTVTVPADWSEETMTLNGYIHVYGYYGRDKTLGKHREIGYESAVGKSQGNHPSNLNLGTLPEIILKVKPAPVPATGVTLDKESVSLRVTETVTLVATPTPANTTEKGIWESSNEAVATVENGVVKAVGEGTATIKVTVGNYSAACQVTVDSEILATGLTLNRTQITVEPGKLLYLTAKFTPEDTTDKTITWTSSDETVATVDGNGVVSTKKAGTAVITAESGSVSATCQVTVKNIEDTDNTVSVYFSISHDAQFLMPTKSNKVMALQKIDVPYFDLALYGLDTYKVPETEGKVTAMHLYIYATEVFYYGITADKAGQGYLYEENLLQNSLVFSGSPGSSYITKFWDYGENLNYYLNYQYPLYPDSTEGATSDRIILHDGDIVTVGHFTDGKFHSDPTSVFNYITVVDGSAIVCKDATVNLQVYRAGANMGNGNGTHSPVAQVLDVYYAKADAAASGDVTQWDKLGTTDATGKLAANISLDPGQYIVAVAGRKGVNTDAIVSAPGAILLTVLEDDATQQVNAVMALIDEIGEVTLAKEAAIDAAWTAYQNLDENQQPAVTNINNLLEAKKTLAALQKEKEDQDAAAAFVAKVEAIGTVTATDDCKSKIDSAKSAYGLLSDDQKKLVTEAKAKLDKAETDYAKLIANEQDNAAADAVEAKIAAIGTVTLNSEAAIKEGRAAYNALSDTQKALVENIDILAAAEKKLAELKDKAAADAVTEMIAAIVEVKLDSEDAVKAARAAYEALSDEQKAFVDVSSLEALEEALALLKLAGTDITKMYQETGSHLAGLSAPGVGTTNGEWRVIGLSRAGKSVADSYYNAVVKFVQENIDENGRLHESKSTDNSRLIVALTAIGKDVTDVGGYDLLSGLNDMTYIGNQGINGTIWALIAFDTHDYEIPAGDVTREKLVQTILKAQKAGGGWALSGSVGDPDMTGMALQALAPYYQTNASVKAAVDKALTWLSSIQAKDGTFTCSEGITSESLAQVITGLTALGINPETDSRFVKNGVSAVDALSKFYLGDGKFQHGQSASAGFNMMATEQAYYALVSYYRLLQGKTSLYDMSDVTIAVPVYKIIEGANSDWQKDDAALTIRADGEFAKFTGVKVDGKLVDSKHYTAKAGSTVITFTTDYLKTLSEGEHTITVTFADGEASTSVSILPTDEVAAKRVMDAIDAIGTVTEDSGDKIKAARKAYDALTAEQKKLVTNYKILTDAESAYDLLISKISVTFTLLGCYKHDSDVVHTLSGGNLSTWIAGKTYKVEFGATIKDVLDKALKEAGMSCSNPTGNYVESINGIGEFSNGSNSGWMYTLNGTHPNLGVAQQTVKDGDVIVFHYTDDYTKEKGGMGFGEDTKIKAVEELIDAIGTVTLESEAKIAAARKAYDGLTYAQKQKVENYSKLTTAEAKYAELKKADDEKKADAVETLIDKLDSNSATFEADTKAAKAAYDKLTADQKKLVDNYAKLVAALKELADDEDKEAAEAVEKLIEEIGTVTTDSEDKIKAAREAYDKLTDEQKVLVENITVLEAAEEKLAKLKALAEVEKIYETTGSYLEELGTPGVGTVGGEWMVVGLLRSGRELKDADGYYDAVVKFVQENIDENGRLHHAKSTENSRIILALTAMGKDVTDVGGYNLLTGLDNMEYVRKQGINGPIWALIALDSGNYPAPEGDVTREALIQVILNAQLADGGWALTGTVSDPDITGMALQALAPYCDTNADVKKVVEEAIAALSMMQAADGSFASIDGTSSESVAQVIAALSALGIDADTDSRFIKNDVSALDALCTFFVKGGGFKHVPDGKLDGMATEQSYYALVAYFRMLDGKPALFDMTDVVDMGGDVTAEEPVETLPVETEPAPTEPVEVPTEGGRSFPWWLVIVIVVLAGAIVVLVIISKPKKGRHMK